MIRCLAWILLCLSWMSSMTVALTEQSSFYTYFRVSSQLISGQSEESLLGGAKLGTNDLIRGIRNARQQDHCKGFVIRIGAMGDGIAWVGLIQDIRSELLKAKLEGKEVLVYLEDWVSLPEYYLASIADKIVISPLGTMGDMGLSVDIRKSKRVDDTMLNEYVIASGTYKSTFNASSTVPLNKVQEAYVESLIQGLFAQVKTDIQESRSLDWDRVSEIFDGRMISADQLRSLGLVDDLAYWDEFDEIVFKGAGVSDRDQVIALEQFSGNIDDISIRSKAHIAIIEINGNIVLGQTPYDSLLGGRKTGADDFRYLIKQVIQNPLVKGVLLRINSSGGSLVAADQIYHMIEVFKSATHKPVYASLGNLAASGAYYIAVAADQIYANPGSLTGSIGVISTYPHHQADYQRAGMEVQSSKTGEYVGFRSSSIGVSDSSKQMIQAYQDQKHDLFAMRVKENRLLSEQSVKQLAQGQLFTGKDAQQKGLVDQLGNFYDAIDGLTKALHLSKPPELIYYRTQSQRDLKQISDEQFQELKRFVSEQQLLQAKSSSPYQVSN